MLGNQFTQCWTLKKIFITQYESDLINSKGENGVKRTYTALNCLWNYILESTGADTSFFSFFSVQPFVWDVNGLENWMSVCPQPCLNKCGSVCRAYLYTSGIIQFWSLFSVSIFKDISSWYIVYSLLVFVDKGNEHIYIWSSIARWIGTCYNRDTHLLLNQHTTMLSRPHWFFTRPFLVISLSEEGCG